MSVTILDQLAAEIIKRQDAEARLAALTAALAHWEQAEREVANDERHTKGERMGARMVGARARALDAAGGTP